MTPRRPFWLRPKWVVGHILCFTLVVLFVTLGLWQLRRLDQRQALNERIQARMGAPAASLVEALRNGADAAEYRRVELEGRWLGNDTVLVRSRSLGGRPGYHVVTPLLTGAGGVLVNRGFAPVSAGGEDVVLEEIETPAAGVVEGIVRTSEVRSGIGPKDPDRGRLRVVSRIDVNRIGQQVEVPLAPVYVQLTAPAPPAGELPVVLPEPQTSEGPHLSYAVQWFIFASVGAVGWPILLRRTGRDHDGNEAL